MAEPKLPEKKERPSVFEYHDYRLYLKDCLEFLAQSGRYSSLRAFAREAGIAAGYLPMLLSGQRKISSLMRKRVLKHLDLNEDEKKYFALICTLADSESVAERVEALNKIQKIRFYRKENPRETEVFRYLARWYFVAIRELAMLPGFKADPFWIQSRLAFPVSIREIEHALEFLIEHKFLVKNESGILAPPEKLIQCKGEIFSVALAQLYRQSFHLAAESLDQVERERRHIRGKILPVSRKNYEQVKEILEEALKKISDLSLNEKNADSVYYVGAMSFPMADADPILRNDPTKKGKP